MFLTDGVNVIMVNDKTDKLPLFSLLTNGRLWRGPFTWVVALFVLANLAVLRTHRAIDVERADNLLRDQGEGNGQVLTNGELKSVRYDISCGDDIVRYWHAIPDATTHPLVFLCGMSQMYAINEFRPGDETISELMDDQIAPRGVRVFGLAAPNLCNEEALFLLLSTSSSPCTKPKVYIYGVCFDKYRNVDLRSSYQLFLLQHPDVSALWEATAAKYGMKYPLASGKMLASLRETKAEEKKVAEDTLEARLRRFASRSVPLVGARKEINGAIQLRLFFLRNWLLDIKPTTKRPIIEGRFNLNKEFLRLMIDVAQCHGVTLVFYIIPLNPLAENPYIPAQYVEFKAWLEGLCREQRIPFANLEGIVPSEHWGTFMGGPDFKHFKGEGHRLTARALLDHFGSLVLAAPPLRTQAK